MSEGIVCKGLIRSFGERKVLKEVSFSLPSKGLFGIAGASGCGKSTLMNILSLLDNDYQGEYRLFGKNPRRWDETKKAQYRLKNIGYVFQQFNLLDLESVEENLLLPLSACFDCSTRLKKQKVQEALKSVGLGEFKKRIVSTLSGGEKQRAAIARATINSPSLLLLDEPTAALDKENAVKVFDILQKLSSRCLVVVVSHDEEMLAEYCEGILKLEDGTLTDFKIVEEEAEKGSHSKMALSKERHPPRFPFLSLLKHAFHLLKHKKWRSIVTEGSICFGLIGIGLSFFLSSSLSKQLNASLSSIVPENQIVMGKRNESASSISNVYAYGLEEMDSLKNDYRSHVLDYGASYLLNFEEWFCDDNDFCAIQGSKSIHLQGFSMRSINDYQWLDCNRDALFYPSTPAMMDWDDVTFGLTYANMFQLCYGLGIERSFESLGRYLSESPLPIIVNASHLEWGFQDEQIFNLVAVTQTKKNAIFHWDHLWAREILVERMKFKPAKMGDSSSPQAIYEVPYLEFSTHPSEFLRKIRLDEERRNLVFEKASSTFLASLLEEGDASPYNRLYVFSCDKSGPTWGDIASIAEDNPEIIGRDAATSVGIFASNDSVLTGTATHLFLSPNEEDVKVVSETYGRLPYSQKDALIELPSSCRDTYIYENSAKPRLSFDCEGLLSGVSPSSYEEIVVSSSLFEAWGKPEEIYVAGEVYGEESDSFYDRTFTLGVLKIVGVKEEQTETIYLPKDWTADFYFFVLDADPFLLEPYGAVFQIDGDSEIEPLLEKLNRAYPTYRFTSPSLEVSSTIEESLGYIKEILICFSAFSFLMSCLLFMVVLGITIKENEKENKLLFALGATRTDICKSLFCHTLVSTLGALISSVLSMFALEFVVSLYLEKELGGSAGFRISWEPILGMCGSAILFSLIVLVTIFFRMRKRKLW